MRKKNFQKYTVNNNVEIRCKPFTIIIALPPKKNPDL